MLLLAAAGLAAAQSAPAPSLPELWVVQADDATRPGVHAAGADFPAEFEARKSYWIPALEIVGFDVLLNQYNRHFVSDEYKSNLSTIRRNLHSSWVVDSDPFRINQLGHPYQGSLYHTFARSAGLGYWESAAYTFVGSAFWEIAGENTPPSRNDQINTGIGGTFLGEVLFRTAQLVLENEGVPPFWRELGAAAISPSTGFNRLAFGDRFKPLFASHDPIYYGRLSLGFSLATQNNAGASTTTLRRNEAVVEYALDYGLPGKRGYEYNRPFDYFSFQVAASSANGFENLMTRGLLVGKDYEAGEDYRGVLGLFGQYDYLAPQTFRVSSTALSLGTTGQYQLSRSIAMQGTALVGAGYAAVGTIRSSNDNDYHYGVAPQALLALRMIFGDTAALDVTGREYFVTRVAAAARAGRDNIARLDAAMTLRVRGRHAIALKYLGNRRDTAYPDVGDSLQTRSTVGLYYVLLGHDRFGATEWR